MLTKDQLRVHQRHKQLVLGLVPSSASSSELQLVERLWALVCSYEGSPWSELERAFKETPEWNLRPLSLLITGLKSVLFQWSTALAPEPFEDGERGRYLELADELRSQGSSYQDFVAALERRAGRSFVELTDLVYGNLPHLRRVKIPEGMNSKSWVLLYNQALMRGVLDQSPMIKVLFRGCESEMALLLRHLGLWGLKVQGICGRESEKKKVGVRLWQATLEGPGEGERKYRHRWLKGLLSAPWPSSCCELHVGWVMRRKKVYWQLSVGSAATFEGEQKVSDESFYGRMFEELRQEQELAPEVARLLGSSASKAYRGVEFRLNPQPLVGGLKGRFFLFEWQVVICSYQLREFYFKPLKEKGLEFLKVAMKVFQPWQQDLWCLELENLKLLPSEVDALWVVPESWLSGESLWQGDLGVLRAVVGYKKEPQQLDLAKKILEKVR